MAKDALQQQAAETNDYAEDIGAPSAKINLDELEPIGLSQNPEDWAEAGMVMPGADDSVITRGFKSGIEATKGLAYGAAAAAGDAVGSEKLRQVGIEGYQRSMDMANLYRGDIPEFTDLYESDDTTIKDVLDYTLFTLGNVAPTIATSVASAGAGGILARVGGKAAISKMMTEQLAKGVSKDVAAKAVGSEIAKRMAVRTKIGQAIGGYVASTGMAAGSIYPETGDLGVTAVHAALVGALDTVTPLKFLNKFGAGKLANAAKQEIVRSIPVEIAKSSLIEGGTEGLQSLVEQHAEYWVRNNGESLLSNLGEVDYRRLINETAGGVIGGAAFGGGGEVASRIGRQPAPPPTKEDEVKAEPGKPVLLGLPSPSITVDTAGQAATAEQRIDATAQRQQEREERAKQGIEAATEHPAYAKSTEPKKVKLGELASSIAGKTQQLAEKVYKQNQARVEALRQEINRQGEAANPKLVTAFEDALKKAEESRKIKDEQDAKLLAGLKREIGYDQALESSEKKKQREIDAAYAQQNKEVSDLQVAQDMATQPTKLGYLAKKLAPKTNALFEKIDGDSDQLFKTLKGAGIKSIKRQGGVNVPVAMAEKARQTLSTTQPTAEEQANAKEAERYVDVQKREKQKDVRNAIKIENDAERTLESGQEKKVTSPSVVASEPVKKEQVSDQQATGERAKQKRIVDAQKKRKIVDPVKDNLLTAIKKLGGINRDEAKSQGIDPAHFKEFKGQEWMFPAGGKGNSLDGMAEALSEHGYFSGQYTANELLDKLDRALRGVDVRTPEGYAWKAEQDAKQRRIEKAFDPESDVTPESVLEFDHSELGDEYTGEDKALGELVSTAIEEGVSKSTIEKILDDNDSRNAAIQLLSSISEARNDARQNASNESGGQRPQTETQKTPRAEEIQGIDAGISLETDEEIDAFFGFEPELTLETQTEESLRKQAEESKAKQDAEAKAAKKADEKAKADSEADDFVLSGSNRPADVAASRGQNDLFGAGNTKKEIDAKANEAATSPKNDLPEPTEAQIEAGNYKKGAIKFQGLDISIENPKGSTRSGTDPDGNKWESKIHQHYGYIKRTEGADGEHVDVFVGDNPESEKVFIIDQVNKDGSFDEHKIMLAMNDKKSAIAGYKKNYQKGWKVGPVTEMSVDEFKEWLEGDTTKPLDKSLNVEPKKPAVEEKPESQPAESKDLSGTYSHTRHQDVKATVTKTDTGYQIEWSTDDVQVFKGKNAEANAAKALEKEGYSKQEGNTIDDRNIRFSRAYHGTPHRFDRFSLEAIGTGEGAQAYGWGLYFAGKKEVAEYYKDKLTRNYSAFGDVIKYWVDQANGDRVKAAKLFETWTRDNHPHYRYNRNESFVGDHREIYEGILNGKGSLYQVDIPEDNKLLDWDKQLSEQSDLIKRAISEKIEELKNIQKTYMGNWGELSGDYSVEDMTGGEIYRALSSGDMSAGFGSAERGNPKAASEYLNSIGIPGLRYLDGTSRDKGDGSYNYVIWDESRVTVEAVNDELRQAVQYAKDSNGATPRGLTVEQAEKTTDEFFKSYPGGTTKGVRVFRTQYEAFGPKATRERYGRIKAGYDADTDEVIVIASNLDSVDDLVRTLQHEIIAHKGLGLLPQEEINELLEAIESTAKVDKELGDLWKAVQKDYKGEPPQVLAEEVIGRIAESRMNLGWRAFAKLKSILTKILRSVGLIKGETSKAEIMTKLYELGDLLREGVRPSPRNLDSIMFARRAETDTEEATAPTRSIRATIRDQLDAIRFQMQDKLIDLKRIQENVNPEDEANAYQKAAIWEGKAGERIHDFDEAHVQPLLEQVAASGLNIDQIGEWLVARHAEEANEYLAEINPDKPADERYRLAGMSNEEAAAILAEHRSNATLQEVGRLVDEINEKRVDMLITEGLITPEMASQWRGRYKHYVPLKRVEAEGSEHLPPRGQGFNIKGKESKMRKGSAYWTPGHILGNTIAQMESSIIRAEKNKVGEALLNFVEQNPNEDFWHIDRDRTMSVVRDGKVVEGVKPFESPNELVVKRNGVENVIVFNTQNERAARLVKGLKNLQAAEMGTVIRALSTVTRFLSTVNTTWNPEFVITNFARDIQTATYNLSSTELADMKKRVLKDVLPAMRGIKSALFGDGSDAWAETWDDFRKQGGKTGWIDLHKDILKKEENLKEIIERLKQGKDAKPNWKRFLDAIDNLNAVVENGVRLSAYKNALDAGLSKERAAALAKDLTVNFNRKGAMGPTMNALYMFYNAGVQGNVRLLQTMANSKQGRRLAMATIGFAVFLDMINRANSGDDEDGENLYDEIPDFIKDHNIIVMGEKEPIVKIPAPWGYNVLHTLGQTIGEAMTGERFSALDSSARVAGAIVDAFNPMGSGTIAQMLSPTITDPIVQISENKSFAGTPLKPEHTFDSRNPRPEYQMHWSSAREMSKDIAKFLNDNSGGNEVRPGQINLSPEWIDLVIDMTTGGLGRTVANTQETLSMIIQGKELNTDNIPFLRKLTGYTNDFGLKGRYYDWSKDIAYAKSEIKLGEDADPRAKSLIFLYNSTEKQLKALRKVRKKLVETNASEEKIKAVDKKILAVMARFNKAYANKMF